MRQGWHVSKHSMSMGWLCNERGSQALPHSSLWLGVQPSLLLLAPLFSVWVHHGE